MPFKSGKSFKSGVAFGMPFSSNICPNCGASQRIIGIGRMEYEPCDCELVVPISATVCTFCDKKVSAEER